MKEPVPWVRFVAGIVVVVVAVTLNWLDRFDPPFLAVWTLVTVLGAVNLLVSALRKGPFLSVTIQALLAGVLIGATLLGLHRQTDPQVIGQLSLALLPVLQFVHLWGSVLGRDGIARTEEGQNTG